MDRALCSSLLRCSRNIYISEIRKEKNGHILDFIDGNGLTALYVVSLQPEDRCHAHSFHLFNFLRHDNFIDVKCILIQHNEKSYYANPDPKF